MSLEEYLEMAPKCQSKQGWMGTWIITSGGQASWGCTGPYSAVMAIGLHALPMGKRLGRSKQVPLLRRPRAVNTSKLAYASGSQLPIQSARAMK